MSDDDGNASGASGYSRSATILSGVLLVVRIRNPGQRLDQPGHLRTCRHDLLEVVEEQERLPVADEGDEPVSKRPSFGLLHVEHLGESGEKVGGIFHVGQADKRDTVEELGCEQPAELDEDPGLSDTAGSGDRDDPMVPGKLDERVQVNGPPYQRPARVGQVARQAYEPLAFPLERPWVRHDDAVGGYRVELEWAPDVLEPEPPQADDADVAQGLDLVVHGVGHHHSPGHRE